MPARKVCQNFFQNALAPFHKYRQNALLDATTALISGASLTLTSIGRFLPGSALYKAISYPLKPKTWASLVRFLEDGRVPMENNRAERAIRPVAMGRSNWLFAGSLAAG